jgi:hypothetical protein
LTGRAQRAHETGFVGQRIARIVVQREVDHHLDAAVHHGLQLRFARLAGAAELFVDATVRDDLRQAVERVHGCVRFTRRGCASSRRC